MLHPLNVGASSAWDTCVLCSGSWSCARGAVEAPSSDVAAVPADSAGSSCVDAGAVEEDIRGENCMQDVGYFDAIFIWVLDRKSHFCLLSKPYERIYFRICLGFCR